MEKTEKDNLTVLDGDERRRSVIRKASDLKEPLLSPNSKKQAITFSQNNSSSQYSFFSLFTYATNYDVFLMILGTLSAMLQGSAMPVYFIVFGNMTDDINDASNLMDVAKKYAIYYLILGAYSFVTSYFAMSSWMITGERQSLRFRKEYFRALLRQDISWYDTQNPNEFSTKIANDTFAIQGALGEKISTFCYVMTMCLGSFVVGYIKGWQLALILTAAIFPMAICVVFYGYVITNSNKKKNEAYEKSGGIAEQALNGIKTVAALCGENKELNRFKSELEITKKVAMKFGIYAGLSLGMMFGVIFANYALGFYAGSKFVANDDDGFTSGRVLTVFFAVITAAMTLGQIAPCIKAFAAGKEAFGRVIKTIRMKPVIDIESDDGVKLENVRGDISFEDLEFAYPLRKENPVLKKVNMFFENGKKTAVVGESGCGKSTCMQLIERFYDVNAGSVKLDGIDTRELNVRWYRENIGYVGQEPVLFATSIKENLLFAKPDATMEQIEAAAMSANAYDFIMALPQKFETFVGSSGAQLSGGQKQRIAIARAILKNPKILLLDEATSALDRKNEIEIQKTLDQISEGRTTIVIAHRLTTIQNADKIIVLDQGRVAEEGTHDSLMAMGTVYPRIQNAQNTTSDDSTTNPNQSAVTYEEEKSPDIQRTNSIDNIDIKFRESVPGRAKKISQSRVDESRYTLATATVKSSVAPQINNDELIKKYPGGVIFKRIFAINKPESLLFFVGCIVAILSGTVFPLFSIIFANITAVLNDPNASDYSSNVNFYCYMFLGIAGIGFVTNFIQISIFTYIGESLAYRIRIALFNKMLRMHMGWFDHPKNAPGNLTTHLAADANLVQNITSSVFSVILQSLTSLVTGVVIAFVASWQVAGVTVLTTPLTIITGNAQQSLHKGFAEENDNAYKESGGFLTEAVSNMRTVASFGNQKTLVSIYDTKLAGPTKRSQAKGIKTGLIFGASQFCVFVVYAVSFYFGIYFMYHDGLSFKDMFMSIFGLMFAAFGSGAASAFMPDMGATQNAARNIFEILDAPIEIQNNERAIKKEKVEGDIEFKNVSFKYPTRDTQIFKDLSFKIPVMSHVAVVGPSGCGKSTIIQLLLRFYDVDAGEILVDGINIKDYDLKFLRTAFGLVSQEPVLFNGTIRYNLTYAKEDATMDEIRQSASRANALMFIEQNDFDAKDSDNKSYGQGFDRLVGPKGSQISGGQKQRIAIARALLKNPSLLLLDEATSALDNSMEKIVQDSLNNVMKQKTCLTIAHRISTIVDSDDILVFLDGNIVERGTFENFMSREGIFFRLSKGIPITMK